MADKNKPVKGKLVSYVYVDNDRGVSEAFGPDDEVPRWAAEKMGAHCFEGGEHPVTGEEDESAEAGPPPKSGRGSSAEAWAKFAEAKGVTVDDAGSREQIIDALEKAGVPTE